MKNRKFNFLMICLLLLVVLGSCSSNKNINQPIQDNTFFVIKILGWLFFQIGTLFNNSFGWAILFTTIIVRTIAWPVYAKGNDISLKMTLMQPDMARLQDKYATRKDPESQQKMQMEMMQLYKKYDINFIGCLVLQILQFFIFTMMWQTVTRLPIQNGLYSSLHSKFLFWDLSQGGESTFASLALIVAGTMILQQFISQRKPKYAKSIPSPNNAQQANTQKTMQYMMFFMAFIMGVTAYSNNALAWYWVVGNLFSLIQMVIGRRLSEKKYNKLQNII